MNPVHSIAIMTAALVGGVGQSVEVMPPTRAKNTAKRIRRAADDVIWASNVERAAADTRRTRRKARDQERLVRHAAGIVRAKANYAKQAAEKAARAKP